MMTAMPRLAGVVLALALAACAPSKALVKIRTPASRNLSSASNSPALKTGTRNTLPAEARTTF